MKKILFPTDFSDTARQAFQYTLQLAKALEAQVHLLHVYQLPFIHSEGVAPEQYRQLLDDLEIKMEEKLVDFLKENGLEGSTMGKKAIYGLFVSREITDYAALEEMDLIVMGTKSKHNVMEKWLGSVTTTTMMHATCPVLAIPADAIYEPIEHIAYASDFKPTDQHAVSQLMTFAKQLGAQVHFLHVETQPDIGQMKDRVVVNDFPFESMEFVLINSPSVLEGVNQYIEEKNIKLMALFIPRRRLWERLFHQSFSKKMAFHSHIPLLSFHA
ncbi:MAG: universal stress protein [Saprospiraceae bacterium]